MNAVLQVALPVFAVIAAGLIAGRTGLASGDDAAALNRFVFRFAMPSALFALMSGASGLTAEDGALALSYGLAAMIVIFSAYGIGRLAFGLSAATAGAHALASTLGNAVFLGLPIALAIEGWGRPFVVMMLVEGILVIAVGASLMSAGSGERPSPAETAKRFLLRPLTNPLVAAALAGFAFATLGAPLGLSLPGPLRTFFEILGRAAGPTALFSVGLFLATNKFPAIGGVAGKIGAIAALKMGVMPVLAFTFAHFLGVEDPYYRGALALFCAVPTAVGAYVMASQYRLYVPETAAAVAATTVLSVATVSAALILFT